MTGKGQEDRQWGWLMAAAFFFVLQGVAVAGPTVRVVGVTAGWARMADLDLSVLKLHRIAFDAIDPNFAEDGRLNFAGTPLVKVLELAGLEQGTEVTVVGEDQYVGYLTPNRLARGILAWERDGDPISPMKGGPLKIMFPEDAGEHASCYTWYVVALVQGRPAGDSLTVTVNGDSTVFERADLMALSEPLPANRVSIAQGCRNNFDELMASLKAVPLNRLIGSLSEPGGRMVEFWPYFGPVVRLRADVLLDDTLIVTGRDDRALHPALGGPFCVVFPVEDHPSLQDRVPESGAYFFLKAIVVK